MNLNKTLSKYTKTKFDDNTPLSSLDMDDIDRAELQMELEDVHGAAERYTGKAKTVGQLKNAIQKAQKARSSAIPKIKAVESKIDELQRRYPKEHALPGKYTATGVRLGSALGGLGAAAASIGVALAIKRPIMKTILRSGRAGLAGSVAGGVAGGLSGAGIGVAAQRKTDYWKKAKPLLKSRNFHMSQAGYYN